MLVTSSGTVNVGPGGVLRAADSGLSGAADIVVGADVGSLGALDVAGIGAIVDSNGRTIVIGGLGNGTLAVTAGGFVDAGTGDIDIAEQAGGNGQLTVRQGGTIAVNAVNVGAPGTVSLTGGTLKESGAAAAGLNAGTISGFGTWIGQLTNDVLVSHLGAARQQRFDGTERQAGPRAAGRRPPAASPHASDAVIPPRRPP